jgi:hypothetical protein
LLIIFKTRIIKIKKEKQEESEKRKEKRKEKKRKEKMTMSSRRPFGFSSSKAFNLSLFNSSAFKLFILFNVLSSKWNMLRIIMIFWILIFFLFFFFKKLNKSNQMYSAANLHTRTEHWKQPESSDEHEWQQESKHESTASPGRHQQQQCATKK